MTQLLRKFLIPVLATAIALGFFAFQALPALACGGLVAPTEQYVYQGYNIRCMARWDRTLHDRIHVPGRCFEFGLDRPSSCSATQNRRGRRMDAATPQS